MNRGCSYPFRQIQHIILSASLLGFATSVTAMQDYREPLDPGMVTEQKTGNEKISQAQIRKLKSYRVGITTEQFFLKDGWNARDPWLGKLGIVQYSKQGNKYRMGVLATDNYKMGDIAQQMYELVKNSDGKSLIRVIDISGEDKASKSTLCMLAFNDGMLTNNSCQRLEH